MPPTRARPATRGRASIEGVAADLGRRGEAAKADEALRNLAGRSAKDFESRAAGIRQSNRIPMAMHQTPKPIIGMINGVAAGAGLSMAAACDIRIAARSARFTAAFIKIGLSGDWGGTWTLTRLIGTAKARELYFTGDIIGAEEALRIGLINQIADDAELYETTMTMARKIAALPRVTLGYTKKNLNAAETEDFVTVMEMEAIHQARCSQTDDHKEAVQAFKEKRRPAFVGR